jgi:hypothetical protein
VSPSRASTLPPGAIGPFRIGLAVLVLAALAVFLGRWPLRAKARDASLPRNPPAVATSDTFVSFVDEALRREDDDMSVTPTGDPDRDFARLMIPHHQGSVDLARAELRFGKDERLRKLAQAIIAEHAKEIDAMRSILDAPPAPRAAASR